VVYSGKRGRPHSWKGATSSPGVWNRLALHVRTDAIGNVLGRTPAPQGGPVVLSGSHLDAVPDGGTFDGAAGAIAALEAARRIAERGVPLARAVEVVGFVEEEGRFTGLLGSAAMMGLADFATLANAYDSQGVSFAEALRAAGLDVSQAQRAVRDPTQIAAFVELHVEQGALLEQAAIPIGLVTSIAGTHRLAVRLRGRTEHAGATPMDRRHDALVVAAEIVAAARRLARATRRETARATVGQLTVRPNVTSAVPGEVDLVVDVRDVDGAARAALAADIEKAIGEASRREGVDWSVTIPMSAVPGQTHPLVQTAIQATCEAMDLPYLRMMSGASHDTLNMLRRVPAGMIFVPSHDGRSHSPAEHTDAEQLAIGTDVLIGTLVRLATDNDTADPRQLLRG